MKDIISGKRGSGKDRQSDDLILKGVVFFTESRPVGLPLT